MGNLHNLFGVTNVAQVSSTAGGYRLESLTLGNTVADVLHLVEYDSQNLLETVRQKIELALAHRSITAKEAAKLLDNYINTLNSYTYLQT